MIVGLFAKHFQVYLFLHASRAFTPDLGDRGQVTPAEGAHTISSLARNGSRIARRGYIQVDMI